MGRDPDDVYLSACLRLATCNVSSGGNSTAFAHTVPLLKLPYMTLEYTDDVVFLRRTILVFY